MTRRARLGGSSQPRCHLERVPEKSHPPDAAELHTTSAKSVSSSQSSSKRSLPHISPFTRETEATAVLKTHPRRSRAPSGGSLVMIFNNGDNAWPTQNDGGSLGRGTFPTVLPRVLKPREPRGPKLQSPGHQTQPDSTVATNLATLMVNMGAKGARCPAGV